MTYEFGSFRLDPAQRSILANGRPLPLGSRALDILIALIENAGEVVDKRESKSRPDAGIVDFVHRAYKQDGTLVAQCRRQAFMRKRKTASDTAA